MVHSQSIVIIPPSGNPEEQVGDPEKNQRHMINIERDTKRGVQTNENTNRTCTIEETVY